MGDTPFSLAGARHPHRPGTRHHKHHRGSVSAERLSPEFQRAAPKTSPRGPHLMVGSKTEGVLGESEWFPPPPPNPQTPPIADQQSWVLALPSTEGAFVAFTDSFMNPILTGSGRAGG